jgi:hypothetical protein
VRVFGHHPDAETYLAGTRQVTLGSRRLPYCYAPAGLMSRRTGYALLKPPIGSKDCVTQECPAKVSMYYFPWWGLGGWFLHSFSPGKSRYQTRKHTSSSGLAGQNQRVETFEFADHNLPLGDVEPTLNWFGRNLHATRASCRKPC